MARPSHTGAELQDFTLGGKRVRHNRWWNEVGSEVSIRPPKNLSVNENNVALPAVASLVALAPGVAANLTMTAQRDGIVRELILDSYDAAIVVGSVREGNIVVTALTVAGENCFAGVGEMPGRTFFPDSFGRPEFDMPVKGGTSVIVTVANRSLGIAGADISAACKID